MHEKTNENILIYDIPYKLPQCAKALCIIFFKVENNLEKMITKYLALFHSDEEYEKNFDVIKCLIMLKSNTSDVYSYEYTHIKINLDADLPSKNTK